MHFSDVFPQITGLGPIFLKRWFKPQRRSSIIYNPQLASLPTTSLFRTSNWSDYTQMNAQRTHDKLIVSFHFTSDTAALIYTYQLTVKANRWIFQLCSILCSPLKQVFCCRSFISDFSFKLRSTSSRTFQTLPRSWWVTQITWSTASLLFAKASKCKIFLP